MGKQIHFEVFVRRGQSPSWVLLDANPKREEAIETAKSQLASGFVTGVKVVKETYDEGAGDYISVVIFEDGTRKFRIKPEAEDHPPLLPCLVPEDLYSVHARHTLTRLISEPLNRWKLTVTELIHRADSLEKLEATGTLFQHAVQKVALAQTGSTGIPVVQIIRAVNELADRAIQRVYKEEASKRVVQCDSPAELAAFAEAKASIPNAAFPIGMAFAKYLAPASNWGAKLDLVLNVIQAPPRDEKAAKIVFQLADQLVSEILGGAAALQELIGAMPDLGTALIAMCDLYLGRPPQGAADSPIGRLSASFAQNALLDARTALARRVLAELRTHKKLAATIDVEMRHLRAITSRLVLGPPALVPHHDIVAAITVRSGRLIGAEAVNTYLTDAVTPLDKLERLMTLEENVIGAENKRRLWDYIKPILASPQISTTLADPRVDLVERLDAAARIQKRLLKSALAEAIKAEGSKAVDDLMRRAIEPARLASSITDRSTGHHIAARIAEAIEAGNVPKGECETMLKDVLRRVVRAA